jgi:hypothetical protein
MKRVIFFVLSLFTGNLLLSQNLVINPGFETWSLTTKPFGWVHTENCLKDSMSVFSGAYSCLHSGGVSASDLGQTIAVLTGKEYLLSFYYKTIITASGNGVRMWCYWKDQNGNNITDPATDAILRPSKYLKSDVWTQFTTSVKAPSDAVSFYLEVRTYPNCSAYWDDFIFKEDVQTYNPESVYNNLRLHPNPASDILTISNLRKLQSIYIHDLSGNTLWSSGFSGEIYVRIPVSGLSDGLYIIRILDSGNWITRKFIKKSL